MACRAYYFLKSNNKSPLEEYLGDIRDKRELAAVLALIEKLIALNGRLPMPLAKHVKGKIWELRSMRFGNRIFYFIQAGNEIIFLDGYTKKRDRIERHILERIMKTYNEYLITQRRKPY